MVTFAIFGRHRRIDSVQKGSPRALFLISFKLHALNSSHTFTEREIRAFLRNRELFLNTIRNDKHRTAPHRAASR